MRNYNLFSSGGYVLWHHLTRKHSSRIHTAHLCWTYLLQKPPDISVVGREGVESQVNESLMVATRDHWQGHGWGVQYLMSGRGLYCKVTCIMGNDYMGSPCGQTVWQTYMTENITFPQLHWDAVKLAFIFALALCIYVTTQNRSRLLFFLHFFVFICVNGIKILRNWSK